MRCYTVGRIIDRGIQAELVSDGVIIRLDTESTKSQHTETFMPLEKSWADNIRHLHASASKIHEDNHLAPPDIRIGGMDFSEDGTCIIPGPLNEETDKALVLVELGEGDQITAAFTKEIEVNGVVKQVYGDLIEALNVCTVHASKTRVLLQLGRGAGFRVVRPNRQPQVFRWPRTKKREIETQTRYVAEQLN